MNKIKNTKEGRKEKKARRRFKKEIKKRVKYLKKEIVQCTTERLWEILEEIEQNPHLNKKELKVLIAKRPDTPNEIIEKLKRDESGTVRFWAHDTELYKFSFQNK